MSTIAVNAITDANAGNTTTINGVTPNSANVIGKNRIINGNMVIDQRNAGSSVTLTTSSSYIVDRWLGLENTDGGMTAQQDTSAPTGFNNSLKFTTTSADSSLAAAQSCRMQQQLEGYNVADLGWGTADAKTVTLSFWVRSSLTGTFAGGLREYNASRGYPFNYTISVANTWEYKTITVTGDTSGTWNTTNSGSLSVIFDLGSGSDYQSTVNAWGAGNYFSTSGATSVISTLNATWQVTGVQLEVGESATEFEHRPYGTELQLCQRYLPWFGSGTDDQIGIGYATGSTSWLIFIPWKVQTRVAPTGIIHGTDSNFNVGGPTSSGIACTALNFSAAGTSGGRVTGSVSSGLTAGQGTYLRSQNTSGYLYFTGCEL
jgi:hypothetical protein